MNRFLWLASSWVARQQPMSMQGRRPRSNTGRVVALARFGPPRPGDGLVTAAHSVPCNFHAPRAPPDPDFIRRKQRCGEPPIRAVWLEVKRLRPDCSGRSRRSLCQHPLPAESDCPAVPGRAERIGEACAHPWRRLCWKRPLPQRPRLDASLRLDIQPPVSRVLRLPSARRSLSCLRRCSFQSRRDPRGCHRATFQT